MYPIKKLSEICDIQNGYAFDASLFSEVEWFPIIRIRDLKNSTIQTLYKWEIKDIFIVKKWDYLIWMDWEFRCYEWNNSDALLNQRVCRIVKYHESIYPKFLFYWINKYLKEIEDVTPFVTVKHISSKQIKDIEFPLPPLSTQSRIVARLDSAFASIDEQISLLWVNIADAENIRKSVLIEAFDKNNDSSLKIADIAEIINWWTPDTTIQEYWNGDIFWITPKDMWQLENIYVGETSRKITQEWVNNSSAKILPVNSVVLSSRAPIGHLAINTIPMCTNQWCKWLIPWDSLNHIYLYYFLLHSRDLLNSLWSGTTFKELSSTKLKEVEIALPPLPRQHEIVAHLDRVFAETEVLRGEYEAQIRDLEILKQSLLQEAFAGRLITD